MSVFIRLSAAFLAAALTWLATMGGGWWLVLGDPRGHGSLDRFAAGALFFAVFSLVVTLALAGVKRPASLTRWVIWALGATVFVLLAARLWPGKMPVPIRTVVILIYDLGFIALGCLGGIATFRFLKSYGEGAPVQSV